MDWKDKLHIIVGCSVLVGATNLMTIPEAYADDDTMDNAEHCMPLQKYQSQQQYVDRLEQLVSDLYVFKVQSKIDIAEEKYRTKRQQPTSQGNKTPTKKEG